MRLPRPPPRFAAASWSAIVVGSIVMVAAIAGSAVMRVTAIRSSPVFAAGQHREVLRAEVVVTGDPVARRDGSTLVNAAAGVWVPVRVERLFTPGGAFAVRVPARLLAPSSWAGLLPGSRCRAGVQWTPSPSLTVAARGTTNSPPVLLGPPPRYQRWAGQFRYALAQATRGLRPSAALVPALVDGDTSAVPEQVIDDLRLSGLAHLSAVSGANVAIAVGAIVLLARRLRVRGRALTAVGAATVIGFVVVARPEGSVIRAAVMALIAMAASLRGGVRQAGAVLGAAVALLLVVNPLLMVDLGFVLSVAATAGLVLLAPLLSRILRGRGWRPRIADAWAVVIAAQVAVTPVLVGFTGRLDPVAVPANLLAAPAVVPITVLGFAAMLIAPVAPLIAQALVWCAQWPAQWVMVVAATGAQWPGGVVSWRGGWWASAMWALAVAAVIAVALVRRWTPRHTWLVPPMVAVVVIALVPIPPALQWPRDWLFLACDVGQGDALALATGRASAIVIDVGPDARRVDRCLRDAGVRRIDALVLTHFHADHVNGLAGALHHRATRMLVTSPLTDPPAEAALVRHIALTAAPVGAQRMPMVAARPGMHLTVGPWQLSVLEPWATPTELAAPADGGSAPNNASVAMLAQRGSIRVLLAGDLEIEGQRRLLRHWAGELHDIEVLKVAHHGSARQYWPLWESLHPKIAVISVGRANRYGHPAPSTLGNLRRLRTVIARTDRQGDVLVRMGRRGTLEVLSHPVS